ncbi:MAG: T9SS type A sorting domain-containing protein [Saprospiraceae bacterium]|nr:T9SS type A sorting domain-containing protein [Saprospiraceae bacterium]
MKIHLFKLLLLLPFVVACQTLSPRLVCALPDVLRETSGLVVQSPNNFWTLNDSGGEAALYQFDSTGRIKRIVKLSGATNKDWEELSTDSIGNFYVGDFGNNDETRRNLTVYKVLKTDILANNDSATTVNAVKIPFRYADQTAFPPPNAQLYFDAEAFLVWSDSLLIFTKDFDTKPYLGTTHIYGVKNESRLAEQAVPRLDSFTTDASWKYNGAIVGAAISPDRSKVVLMSYQKLWIFTNFTGKQFWKGQRHELSFGLDDFAQREAVAFGDNCRIYITSEKNVVNGISNGGNLSTLSICDYLRTKNTDIVAHTPRLRAFPNPSVGEMFFELQDSFSENLTVKFYNAQGTIVGTKKIRAGQTRLDIDNQLFTTAGFYLFKVVSEKNTPLSIGRFFIVK